MSDQFWLTRAQLKRIKRPFALSHGVARVDDLRVILGIIHVIRNGLRWRDAPKDYGSHQTLYNRFIRWSRMGVFDNALAAKGIKACIPPRKGRKTKHAYCKTFYRQRHKVEGMFGKIKDWRRIATRYDRCATGHSSNGSQAVLPAPIFA